jgi:hypothetical protein
MSHNYVVDALLIFANIRHYGYASIQAYLLYKNPAFLSLAQSFWELGNTYTLSAAQVAAGNTGDLHNYILSDCQPGKLLLSVISGQEHL